MLERALGHLERGRCRLTNGADVVELDVAVRHGRMHCTLHGKGEPLVFLHGALGTGEAHFRRQIDELARDYSLVVLDFLGYGRSGRRDIFDGAFHTRDAEDVVALIEQLDVSPVHLCGFSDGAIVSMVVATRYGELLRSLTLIGGQAVLDEKGVSMTRKWIPPEQLATGFRDALARYHGDPYWSELVTKYVDAMEELYAAGGDPIGASLEGITCPTLIVQGALDPWVDVSNAHHLHVAIPGSRLEVVRGAGHEVQRDRAGGFNQLLLEFLASVGQGAT